MQKLQKMLNIVLKCFFSFFVFFNLKKIFRRKKAGLNKISITRSIILFYTQKMWWKVSLQKRLWSPIVGFWRFKLYRKWQKGCTISSCCILDNDTIKWFLINWGQDKNTQGVHEHSKFWENVTACWVTLWTTNTYSLMDC